ncbi:ABC transporter ATP-binding protein [Polaromonas jejuensis]|uniref:ABC transporter ATP-binding protein n=1 Tax=Polaromonas jejuensis TaxID=457502 RepID=A0ABW0QBZ9_9BURK|nr:ABC transporter ATP-binding protein [Polaromonas jejuensis]
MPPFATPAPNGCALELLDICCTFRSREDAGQRYAAVSNTTLRINAGEFVSVVGPTGCGKSTLLNIGAGLLAPSSGAVRVFGQALHGINARAGYMFQSDALMPWRSALENVMLGLQYRGVPDGEARSQAQAWLARVGLGDFGDRYPHQLSGGMRKRAALAQVLALDPDIILMDEPFSALDIQTRQLMENEVLDLWAGPGEGRRAAPRPEPTPSGGGRAAAGGSYARKAVLFITHDLDEAIAMSDRVVVLSAGPGTHPMGEFIIDLPRPRDVAEVRHQPRFVELHTQIWSVLRDEVLKGYAQQLKTAA